MSDLASTIDTWLDAYGEPGEARRVELIAQLWSPSGRLVDPPIEGSGHQGINQLVAAALEHYPGARFRRTSGIDSHHNFARYTWELVGSDGNVAVGGLDIVEVDEEGRLLGVVGFFGDLPPFEATNE